MSVVRDTIARWLKMLVVLHVLCFVYADVTLARSNVRVKVTDLLKFRNFF